MKSSFVLDADLITLRALIAIVDKGSFSAAAKQIGRTQSAVSLQMTKLEERLQVSLLERTSRSVKLTPAGEIFTSYVRRIIELSDEGFAAVSSPENSEPLRIGFAEYLVPQHLQKLLSRFKRGFPRAKLELNLGLGFALYNDLIQNDLDVVVAGPEAEGGIELLSEPLVWVGSKTRELNPDEKSMKVILMQPPCSYRKAALDSLSKAGIMWQESVSVNSIQAIQSAVAAGFGISVMPRSACNSELAIIRVGLPMLSETSIHVYWNKTNPHPLTKRFINLIEEELELIGVKY